MEFYVSEESKITINKFINNCYIYELKNYKEVKTQEEKANFINYFPSIITNINLINFNEPIDNLANGVEILHIGKKLNQSLNNLPNSIKILYLGDKFKQSLNNLPNSIETIHLNDDLFNNNLNNLPLHLKNIFTRSTKLLISKRHINKFLNNLCKKNYYYINNKNICIHYSLSIGINPKIFWKILKRLENKFNISYLNGNTFYKSIKISYIDKNLNNINKHIDFINICED